MIRPATPADRTLLREMFDEFYASDAVLHPIPASSRSSAAIAVF